MSQTADVIDLKTYRERKSEQRRAAETASASAAPNSMQVALPFAMPVMFFMVWPAWVVAPQPALAWNEGGSGAA